MKVVITGGLGFIGSNLIRYLITNDSEVEITNLDNLSIGSNIHNLDGLGGKGKYHLVRGDICDFELVSGIVAEAELVVNLAAQTHVDRSITSPSAFFCTNLSGTLALLEAVRRFNDGARFLQVGTDEVYGSIASGSVSETGALNPSSPYAASKASADLLALSYHRTYGLDTLVTRCTNNFGPFQFPEKFIPKVIMRAILGLEVPIYGDGNQVRSWLYVVDHARALWLASKKGEAGSIYNISAANEISNLDVATAILGFLKKSPALIKHVEDRPGHDRRYSLNSSKIRNELGWNESLDFNRSLRTTVEWYVNNQSWWKPLVTGSVLDETPWKLGAKNEGTVTRS